jgi:hypothetical protein
VGRGYPANLFSLEFKDMNITLYALLIVLTLPLSAIANEYPTLDRVDHVLTCMKKHGGQTMDNLYACACEIDTIALMMPYDTFIEASTFESYRNMPGERGGMFRDSTQGEKLVTQLHKAQEEAERRCFIRTRTVKPK